ncbi:hypothetical protein GCM10023238_32450 [Streptomyces heliomycini]
MEITEEAVVAALLRAGRETGTLTLLNPLPPGRSRGVLDAHRRPHANQTEAPALLGLGEGHAGRRGTG